MASLTKTESRAKNKAKASLQDHTSLTDDPSSQHHQKATYSHHHSDLERISGLLAQDDYDESSLDSSHTLPQIARSQIDKAKLNLTDKSHEFSVNAKIGLLLKRANSYSTKEYHVNLAHTKQVPLKDRVLHFLTLSDQERQIVTSQERFLVVDSLLGTKKPCLVIERAVYLYTQLKAHQDTKVLICHGLSAMEQTYVQLLREHVANLDLNDFVICDLNELKVDPSTFDIVIIDDAQAMLQWKVYALTTNYHFAYCTIFVDGAKLDAFALRRCQQHYEEVLYHGYMPLYSPLELQVLSYAQARALYSKTNNNGKAYDSEVMLDEAMSYLEFYYSPEQVQTLISNLYEKLESKNTDHKSDYHQQIKELSNGKSPDELMQESYERSVNWGLYPLSVLHERYHEQGHTLFTSNLASFSKAHALYYPQQWRLRELYSKFNLLSAQFALTPSALQSIAKILTEHDLTLAPQLDYQDLSFTITDNKGKDLTWPQGLPSFENQDSNKSSAGASAVACGKASDSLDGAFTFDAKSSVCGKSSARAGAGTRGKSSAEAGSCGKDSDMLGSLVSASYDSLGLDFNYSHDASLSEDSYHYEQSFTHLDKINCAAQINNKADKSNSTATGKRGPRPYSNIDLLLKMGFERRQVQAYNHDQGEFLDVPKLCALTLTMDIPLFKSFALCYASMQVYLNRRFGFILSQDEPKGYRTYKSNRHYGAFVRNFEDLWYEQYQKLVHKQAMRNLYASSLQLLTLNYHSSPLVLSSLYKFMALWGTKRDLSCQLPFNNEESQFQIIDHHVRNNMLAHALEHEGANDWGFRPLSSFDSAKLNYLTYGANLLEGKDHDIAHSHGSSPSTTKDYYNSEYELMGYFLTRGISLSELSNVINLDKLHYSVLAQQVILGTQSSYQSQAQGLAGLNGDISTINSKQELSNVDNLSKDSSLEALAKINGHQISTTALVSGHKLKPEDSSLVKTDLCNKSFIYSSPNNLDAQNLSAQDTSCGDQGAMVKHAVPQKEDYERSHYGHKVNDAKALDKIILDRLDKTWHHEHYIALKPSVLEGKADGDLSLGSLSLIKSAYLLAKSKNNAINLASLELTGKLEADYYSYQALDLFNEHMQRHYSFALNYGHIFSDIKIYKLRGSHGANYQFANKILQCDIKLAQHFNSNNEVGLSAQHYDYAQLQSSTEQKAQAQERYGSAILEQSGFDRINFYHNAHDNHDSGQDDKRQDHTHKGSNRHGESSYLTTLDQFLMTYASDWGCHLGAFYEHYQYSDELNFARALQDNQGSQVEIRPWSISCGLLVERFITWGSHLAFTPLQPYELKSLEPYNLKAQAENYHERHYRKLSNRNDPVIVDDTQIIFEIMASANRDDHQAFAYQIMGNLDDERLNLLSYDLDNASTLLGFKIASCGQCYGHLPFFAPFINTWAEQEGSYEQLQTIVSSGLGLMAPQTMPSVEVNYRNQLHKESSNYLVNLWDRGSYELKDLVERKISAADFKDSAVHIVKTLNELDHSHIIVEPYQVALGNEHSALRTRTMKRLRITPHHHKALEHAQRKLTPVVKPKTFSDYDFLSNDSAEHYRDPFAFDSLEDELFYEDAHDLNEAQELNYVQAYELNQDLASNSKPMAHKESDSSTKSYSYQEHKAALPAHQERLDLEQVYHKQNQALQLLGKIAPLGLGSIDIARVDEANNYLEAIGSYLQEIESFIGQVEDHYSIFSVGALTHTYKSLEHDNGSSAHSTMIMSSRNHILSWTDFILRHLSEPIKTSCATSSLESLVWRALNKSMRKQAPVSFLKRNYYELLNSVSLSLPQTNYHSVLTELKTKIFSPLELATIEAISAIIEHCSSNKASDFYNNLACAELNEAVYSRITAEHEQLQAMQMQLDEQQQEQLHHYHSDNFKLERPYAQLHLDLQALHDNLPQEEQRQIILNILKVSATLNESHQRLQVGLFDYRGLLSVSDRVAIAALSDDFVVMAHKLIASLHQSSSKLTALAPVARLNPYLEESYEINDVMERYYAKMRLYAPTAHERVLKLIACAYLANFNDDFKEILKNLMDCFILSAHYPQDHEECEVELDNDFEDEFDDEFLFEDEGVEKSVSEKHLRRRSKSNDYQAQLDHMSEDSFKEQAFSKDLTTIISYLAKILEPHLAHSYSDNMPTYYNRSRFTLKRDELNLASIIAFRGLMCDRLCLVVPPGESLSALELLDALPCGKTHIKVISGDEKLTSSLGGSTVQALQLRNEMIRRLS